METELETRYTSYYANGAYTYNRRYTINGSWRIDKSNLFGLDKAAQNKPVWSVGAKWQLSDERFLKSMNWLNRLALRATYGITGNSPAPGTASSYDVMVAQKQSIPSRQYRAEDRHCGQSQAYLGNHPHHQFRCQTFPFSRIASMLRLTYTVRRPTTCSAA